MNNYDRFVSAAKSLSEAADELVKEESNSTNEGLESMPDTNGNVSSADIATLSLLGRPYGHGYGYGGWSGPWGAGGDYGYGGHHGYGGRVGVENLASETAANGTTVNAKLDANANSLDQQTGFFDSAERSRQFAELSKQNSEERLASQASMNALNNSIRDNAADAAKCCCDTNLSIVEQTNRLQQQMTQIAAEAAKCCCDTNLKMSENTASLMAEIKAVETRGITRELDRAERNLESTNSTNAIIAAMQAQTQQLIGALHHHK